MSKILLRSSALSGADWKLLVLPKLPRLVSIHLFNLQAVSLPTIIHSQWKSVRPFYEVSSSNWARQMTSCVFHTLHFFFVSNSSYQISQLELEIQGIPGSIRPAYALRLRHAKTELSKYSKASKDAQAQVQRNELTARSAAGSNLNANRFQDNPYTDTDDEVNVRSRLVGGVEILSAGQRRLRDSQGVALRTEELGADILRTLRSQRETIEHTRDTVCCLGFLPV